MTDFKNEQKTPELININFNKKSEQIKSESQQKNSENKIKSKNDLFEQIKIKESIKKIIDECKKVKGNSYGSLSKEMEEINQDFGIQLITENYHSNCSQNTS